jgi:hypothetical protein
VTSDPHPGRRQLPLLKDLIMTTVSAAPTNRIRPSSAPAHRVRVPLRALLTGALLVLIAALIVDNHVMALPGGTFAGIGVARAVLQDPAAHGGPRRRGASDADSGRSAHELRRCYVRARRSGQDPATCRTAP